MKSAIMKSIGITVLAVLFLPGWMAAQSQGSGQQGGQQQPQQPTLKPAPLPGQEAPAPAVNPEEEAAYKAFFEVKADPRKRIELGEDFVKKYPQSKYLEGVYSALTTAYLTVGDEAHMFANADRALALNPNDVDVISLLALVTPRRVDTNSLDADQKLRKAENYARQGILLLGTMDKPATISEEDFQKAKNEKLAMCHSGLGLVEFHRQKFADSASELEKATQLAANPDPVDFFILGLSYQQTSRAGDAVTAFGRCATTAQGPFQERCKQFEERAKKAAATQPAPAKP